jgi:hypothetical protein
MLLKNLLQGRFIDEFVPNPVRMDHHNRPSLADGQAVGDGTAKVVGMIRLIQAVRFDQGLQAGLDAFAFFRRGALAPHTNEHPPAAPPGEIA